MTCNFDGFLIATLKFFFCSNHSWKSSKVFRITSPEAGPLTLATIASDLQIKICTFLHPSDILSLRKTCKALLIITKQRALWIDALRRLCLDNTLFLPSFPVDDMSVMEIERATIAPRRWVRRCVAWAEKPRNCFQTNLRPKTTRIIWGPFDGFLRGTQIFLVPGGRYLVTSSPHGVSVWDLGYNSTINCKCVASARWDTATLNTTCLVKATSDGMGLIIVVICRDKHCSVYEIYPLSEAPQLTRIAHNSHLGPLGRRGAQILLMPHKVVYCKLRPDRIIFSVWDYRLNHSMSFSADFDVKKFDYKLMAIAAETMIIVLCDEAIFFWRIPPLLASQSVDHFDHDTTPIPLLGKVPFPDDILHQVGVVRWVTMPSWYAGSSPSSLYFDAIRHDLGLHGFEIVIKPDFSDVSLRLINSTPQLDFRNLAFEINENSICEGALFSAIFPAIYLRPISPCPNVASALGRTVPNMISVRLQMVAPVAASLCSASGRFVCLKAYDQPIAVLDFL